MSAEHDVPESDEGEEKKSYGLVGRIILFLIFAGPTSVFAFGLWSRIGLGGSSTAGAGSGDFTLKLGFYLWLASMIGTAIMIFKK